MGFSARVLSDSMSSIGVRLITLEVTLPRIVLAELNTHRVFSRNSASSRAIPIEKRIAQVEADPFIPERFGKNARGMQALEQLGDDQQVEALLVWNSAMRSAIEHAKQLAEIGVHKQLANRLIEPFSWQTVIITATEWYNFFSLRLDSSAQPEIRTVAEMMCSCINASKPELLAEGEWHTPLVDDAKQLLDDGYTPDAIRMISVGRCARISYLTHDGKRNPLSDIELCTKLSTSGHYSPFEHVARPMTLRDADSIVRKVTSCDFIYSELNINNVFAGNLRAWVSMRQWLRQCLPNESNRSLKAIV